MSSFIFLQVGCRPQLHPASSLASVHLHRAPTPEPDEDPLPGEHPVPLREPVPSPNPEVMRKALQRLH